MSEVATYDIPGLRRGFEPMFHPNTRTSDGVPGYPRLSGVRVWLRGKPTAFDILDHGTHILDGTAYRAGCLGDAFFVESKTVMKHGEPAVETREYVIAFAEARG